LQEERFQKSNTTKKKKKMLAATREKGGRGRRLAAAAMPRPSLVERALMVLYTSFYVTLFLGTMLKLSIRLCRWTFPENNCMEFGSGELNSLFEARMILIFVLPITLYINFVLFVV